MLRPLLLAALLTPSLALAQAPQAPSSPDPGTPPPPIAAHDRGPAGHGAHRGPDRGADRGPEGDRHPSPPPPPGLAGLQVPPGTWWRNPDTVSRLSLSADQVKRIDSLFLDSRIQLIHMHASLEEQELRLQPLLQENPVNQQAALAQVSKIADTRAELEKTDARMLLSIRGVLTGDQWTRLQRHPMSPEGPGGRPQRPSGRGPGSPDGAAATPSPAPPSNR